MTPRVIPARGEARGARPGARPDASLSLRFWGVRGAVPCPGSQTTRYGGNTACVELRCGGQLVVLDGGSGLRPLGEALVADGGPIDADILFSHFHIDHLIGLPFFLPAYGRGNRLRLWGARSDQGHGLRDALDRLMSPPLFPIGPDALQAQVAFHTFARGDTLSLGPGIAVRSAPLNHPGGATGYRVEHAGRAVAYVTDTEHRPDGLDPNVLALARRADVMIYDANYTDAEYPAHVGWGHSTWQQAVRLADAAKVGTLVLFHHDPAHDDAAMDTVAAAALAMRPLTLVAQEGCVLSI